MATAKQLAALEKARAARKRNLTKRKKSATSKRKTTRKKNPVAKITKITEYVIEVTTKDKRTGYLKDWLHFDTEKSSALCSNKKACDALAKALKQMKLPNIGRIAVVKK